MMKKHILSVLAFIALSFLVQGLNHFVINKTYYAGIDFARPEPVLLLGILTMVIQGIVLTAAMTKIAPTGNRLKDGFLVSLAFGLFLAAYIALAEPAKYTAPSISSWFITEGLVSTVQFVIVGFALGLIHKKYA